VTLAVRPAEERRLMNSPPPFSADTVAGSASWFPQILDAVHDRVLLVEKTEAEYREASFLDARSLRPDARQHIVEWPALAAVIPSGARRDAQFIFHIGHVGSTLISRLLGEVPGVLALREPLILRTLAELLAGRHRAESLWNPAEFPARIDTTRALLSRTFAPGQRSMIKATSFTSEIAAEVVPPYSSALLLFATSDRYIENILAGANSRQELRMMAAERLNRLHRRIRADHWTLWTMSEGEMVAMAWASEMTSLLQAADDMPAGTTRWLDFDAFLAAPEAGIAGLARFFGLALDTGGAAALATHRLLGRYSKAPEHAYSPALRNQLLAQARREHGRTIAQAKTWLAAAARDVPQIARCLELAG
jgi:hypothetical protein